MFKKTKIESYSHNCKDNGTSSPSCNHAMPSPQQADYSPGRHHGWVPLMSQWFQKRRMTATISFRPDNCCFKLELLHHYHLPSFTTDCRNLLSRIRCQHARQFLPLPFSPVLVNCVATRHDDKTLLRDGGDVVEHQGEFWHRKRTVVVNLASRPPQFLGSASSVPDWLGGQYGANLVRDYEVPLTKVPHLPSLVPNTTLFVLTKRNVTVSLVSARG